MDHEIEIEVGKDGVALVTLNRPEALNSITDEMYKILIGELPKLGADSAVGAVIVAGNGRAFCAGANVKGMKGNTSPLTYEERVEALRTKQKFIVSLHEMPKVTIAKVHGVAAGAGMSLALTCDFRVASPKASFITSFANVGFSGDFGGTYFLSRLIGPARAQELYLTSEKISAEKALALGIISILTDEDKFDAETLRLARKFANGPRLAYARIKDNFKTAQTGDLHAVLESEALNQIRLAQSEDHTEAIRAFAEKRTPVFKGR